MWGTAHTEEQVGQYFLLLRNASHSSRVTGTSAPAFYLIASNSCRGTLHANFSITTHFLSHRQSSYRKRQKLRHETNRFGRRRGLSRTPQRTVLQTSTVFHDRSLLASPCYQRGWPYTSCADSFLCTVPKGPESHSGEEQVGDHCSGSHGINLDRPTMRTL